MADAHLAGFICRLQHGAADLQRGAAPCAGMQRRRIVEHGRAQFVDHLAARHGRRRQRKVFDAVIAVDPHVFGPGADVAPCAADDKKPEMLVAFIFRRRCRRARPFGAAIGAVGLERGLGLDIADPGQGPPGGAVIRRASR